ncbi:MAG TPA: DUF1800 domain-containing protein [Gemmatimonadales bacterium]|nr:DUF1800 domain-containing protein [Gemmatimonadales bacterium]
MRAPFLSLVCLVVLSTPLPAQQPTAADSARHLLNRLAFGPRPGEVEQIAREGALHAADRMLSDSRPDDQALPALEEKFHLERFQARAMLETEEKLRRQRREAKADSEMTGAGARATGAPRLLPEYQELTVVRAVMARDQLREVMVDFWANHFNVFFNKGADRALLPTYIETVIRPHALGRFEDLLLATARSPAMLFYLDNVRSVAAQDSRLGGGEPARPGRPTGLNENYARELMELHTLGVDGGYTQHDVTEVARILTGWSMTRPADGAEFVFRERAHDYGAKTVLGVRFPAGHGEDEGERLLRMLARHPATLHHISRKLCARFVADDPPDGCVDAAVHAWEASDGDILAVLRAIVHSPEFWAPRAMDNKVKSPLEFIASAARATDATPDTLPGLAQAVARLGQPLFQQASPAGYPERQEDWVNSGALLGRMNTGVALAAGRIAGSAPDLDALAPASADYGALLDAIDHQLFAGSMSARTRAAVTNELNEIPNPEAARTFAIGLALGSPEFQRQ